MLDFYTTASHSYNATVEKYATEECLVTKLSEGRILFVLEEFIRIRLPDKEISEIPKGYMVFLPPEIECTLFTVPDCHLLILKIPDISSLFHHFIPEKIFRVDDHYNRFFYPLKMESYIDVFVKSLMRYIDDDKANTTLTEIKTMELFYFLNSYYSSHSLANFFAPVLSEKYKFSHFVFSHYATVKTVEELAALSSYSLSGFEKQLHKVFGMAPYKWMLQKKAQKIFREIIETNKPFKVIAFENSFSSLSQFSNFCRKYIGSSPMVIRKNKQI